MVLIVTAFYNYGTIRRISFPLKQDSGFQGVESEKMKFYQFDSCQKYFFNLSDLQ